MELSKYGKKRSVNLSKRIGREDPKMSLLTFLSPTKLIEMNDFQRIVTVVRK